MNTSAPALLSRAAKRLCKPAALLAQPETAASDDPRVSQGSPAVRPP